MITPVTALATNVLIKTPLGDIEIELLEEDAPNTVANFLRYVDNNSYNNSFFHRSVPGFVIQGGGFTYLNGNAPGIVAFPPVANEFNISNTRGTVAMARRSGQPDSATSQWFINLADNSDNLDNVDGGFTVFAKVVGNGMQVADAIAALDITVANPPFEELPTINYTVGNPVLESNLVMTEISRVSDPGAFVMNAGLNDAWYNPVTDGQGFFVTVFPDLGVVSLAWFTYDTDLPTQDESANLGDPGHRWLTALGNINGDTAVLNIDIATGGLFDTATVVEHTDPVGSDGTITLSFEDCNTGLVEYDIPSINQQGSVPIQRVDTDNVEVCEALRGE
jgi:cyclophilin family peptidyl-prolyl cis-trans isomerase